MKDFVNKLYRNHSLIYKVLLFLSTIFLIVYMFPKSGKFKYNFDKGKPWQSEDLLAPFDFAIKKSPEELEKEKQTIIENSPVYFDVDSIVKRNVLEIYQNNFNQVIPDSVINRSDKIYDVGYGILKNIYSFGVLDQDYDYPKYKTVILVENQSQTASGLFSDFMSLTGFRAFTEQELQKSGLSKYGPNLISLFFDIIKPNVTLDQSFTDNALQEELNRISPTRGSIERGTLIISKGEIVEGSKYTV